MTAPPQLALFNAKGQLLFSDPLSRRLNPATLMEETHFGCFYPGSHYFGHYPGLMTIGEGHKVDRLVN